MSDGLMSDIFNIKFICTFNADISKIDSALLRKGRCYANYTFKALDKDKVKHLSDKYNLGIKETKVVLEEPVPPITPTTCPDFMFTETSFKTQLSFFLL